MSDSNTLIQSFNDLDSQCKEQVCQDNSKFGTDSIYLPNPVLFTQPPTYCFIGMEPSLNGDKQVFQRRVNNGFLNFFCSEGDFTLHYCAYHFLCLGSFDYHITDIAKGAMNTKDADKIRGKRWPLWVPILEQELRFLNPSHLIAIGSETKKFMEKRKSFRLAHSEPILHYSILNQGRFNCYEPSDKSLPANLYCRLKEFASSLLSDYMPNLKAEILDEIFNKELKQWQERRFLYYRDKFSVIAKGTVTNK